MYLMALARWRASLACVSSALAQACLVPAARTLQCARRHSARGELLFEASRAAIGGDTAVRSDVDGLRRLHDSAREPLTPLRWFCYENATTIRSAHGAKGRGARARDVRHLARLISRAARRLDRRLDGRLGGPLDGRLDGRLGGRLGGARVAAVLPSPTATCRAPRSSLRPSPPRPAPLISRPPPACRSPYGRAPSRTCPPRTSSPPT